CDQDASFHGLDGKNLIDLLWASKEIRGVLENFIVEHIPLLEDIFSAFAARHHLALSFLPISDWGKARNSTKFHSSEKFVQEFFCFFQDVYERNSTNPLGWALCSKILKFIEQPLVNFFSSLENLEKENRTYISSDLYWN